MTNGTPICFYHYITIIVIIISCSSGNREAKLPFKEKKKRKGKGKDHFYRLITMTLLTLASANKKIELLTNPASRQPTCLYSIRSSSKKKKKFDRLIN